MKINLQKQSPFKAILFSLLIVLVGTGLIFGLTYGLLTWTSRLLGIFVVTILIVGTIEFAAFMFLKYFTKGVWVATIFICLITAVLGFFAIECAAALFISQDFMSVGLNYNFGDCVAFLLGGENSAVGKQLPEIDPALAKMEFNNVAIIRRYALISSIVAAVFGPILLIRPIKQAQNAMARQNNSTVAQQANRTANVPANKILAPANTNNAFYGNLMNKLIDILKAFHQTKDKEKFSARMRAFRDNVFSKLSPEQKTNFKKFAEAHKNSKDLYTAKACELLITKF